LQAAWLPSIHPTFANHFMSIDNIKLQPVIIGELYKDSLLAPLDPPDTPLAGPAKGTTRQAASSPASAPSAANSGAGYKLLGNNRRKITVLVQSPGLPFLPDDQLAFFTKMLEACKMNIGDVAIVNHAGSPVNINTLKQQLQPSVLLLFGLEPVAIQLPINFPVFKLQFYDQCTYLSAPSLEELVRPGDESKLLKSKLWVCLKTLFEI
jgi:hypothetical protein